MKSILICTVFSILSFGTFAATNAIADPVRISISPLTKIDITVGSGPIKIHIIGEFSFSGSGYCTFDGTISVGGISYPVHYAGYVKRSMGKFQNSYDASNVDKENLEFVDMIMSNLYLPIDQEKVTLDIPESNQPFEEVKQ